VRSVLPLTPLGRRRHRAKNDMFKGTNTTTGEQVDLTEVQVRAEIIDTLEHDMPTVAEYSDEEIAAAVGAANLDDHFDGGTFEGFNYEITRTV
jgi:hypothetical protein